MRHPAWQRCPLSVGCLAGISAQRQGPAGAGSEQADASGDASHAGSLRRGGEAVGDLARSW